jgi:transmembrane sensor
MAERSTPANEGLPSTASEWLVALAEQPDNAALGAAFEQWLAASPDHARDWAEIDRTSALLAAQPRPAQADWVSFLARRRAEAANRRRRKTWISGLAALAAAACLLLFFQGSTLLLRLEADHVTATAEQRRLQLPDGTIVLLGPESAIDIAYSPEARQVRLLKGEAFFEVSGSDARPFSVRARGLVVRDIGTAFEVRLGVRTTDVAVRDGIVDIAGTGTSERLVAGEWARVAPDGLVERGQVSPDLVAAWTAGQLVVKNRPVAEVVEALRPYFDGMVVLYGNRLPNEPLTGVYNLAEPVEALRAVARAQGATMRRISPWMIVISGE